MSTKAYEVLGLKPGPEIRTRRSYSIPDDLDAELDAFLYLPRRPVNAADVPLFRSELIETLFADQSSLTTRHLSTRDSTVPYPIRNPATPRESQTLRNTQSNSALPRRRDSTLALRNALKERKISTPMFTQSTLPDLTSMSHINPNAFTQHEVPYQSPARDSLHVFPRRLSDHAGFDKGGNNTSSGLKKKPSRLGLALNSFTKKSGLCQVSREVDAQSVYRSPRKPNRNSLNLATEQTTRARMPKQSWGPAQPADLTSVHVAPTRKIYTDQSVIKLPPMSEASSEGDHPKELPHGEHWPLVEESVEAQEEEEDDEEPPTSPLPPVEERLWARTIMENSEWSSLSSLHIHALPNDAPLSPLPTLDSSPELAALPTFSNDTTSAPFGHVPPSGHNSTSLEASGRSSAMIICDAELASVCSAGPATSIPKKMRDSHLKRTSQHGSHRKTSSKGSSSSSRKDSPDMPGSDDNSNSNSSSSSSRRSSPATPTRSRASWFHSPSSSLRATLSAPQDQYDGQDLNIESPVALLQEAMLPAIKPQTSQVFSLPSTADINDPEQQAIITPLTPNEAVLITNLRKKRAAMATVSAAASLRDSTPSSAPSGIPANALFYSTQQPPQMRIPGPYMPYLNYDEIYASDVWGKESDEAEVEMEWARLRDQARKAGKKMKKVQAVSPMLKGSVGAVVLPPSRHARSVMDVQAMDRPVVKRWSTNGVMTGVVSTLGAESAIERQGSVGGKRNSVNGPPMPIPARTSSANFKRASVGEKERGFSIDS